MEVLRPCREGHICKWGMAKSRMLVRTDDADRAEIGTGTEEERTAEMTAAEP